MLDIGAAAAAENLGAVQLAYKTDTFVGGEIAT